MSAGGATAGGAQTNGASLEDCHTNVVVLTELNGLSWKRFVPPYNYERRGAAAADVNEDLVLSAWASCARDGMLCTWRRVPSPQQAARLDLRIDADKELWVFWFQNEPENLNVCTHQLTSPLEDGKGSWERGIEYDVRILLFRAFDAMLERNLLQSGYVRLAKWYVQPWESSQGCRTDNPLKPAYQLAFNFTFFVHGENNVCVFVNVQRQPAVLKLARRHLALSQPQPVVLAPWCLSATLAPASQAAATDAAGAFRNEQQRRLWRDWAAFFPLATADENTENLGYVDPVEAERLERAQALALPRMVEVLVDDVRMHYPAAFVLVLASADSAAPAASAAPHARTAAHSANHVRQPVRAVVANGVASGDGKGVRVGARAVESLLRAVKDDCTPAPSDSETISEQRWQLRECCDREASACTCTPWVREEASRASAPTKAALKFIDVKPVVVERRPLPSKSRLSKLAAFHRRSPLTVRDADDRLLTQSVVSRAASSTPLTVRCAAGGGVAGGGGGLKMEGAAHHCGQFETEMISPVTPCFPTPQPALVPLASVPSQPKAPARVLAPQNQQHPSLSSAAIEPQLRRNCVIRPRLSGAEAVQLVETQRISKRPRLADCDSSDNHLNLASAPPGIWRDFVDGWRHTLETVSASSVVSTSQTPSAQELTAAMDEIWRCGSAMALQPDDDSVDADQQVLTANDLQPEADLPDNFMDDQQTSSPVTNFMSPPASNERMEPVSRGRSAQPHVQHTLGQTYGGPGSVEYTQIYPTPPSHEAAHCQQFSPEMRPQLTQLVPHDPLKVPYHVAVVEPCEAAPVDARLLKSVARAPRVTDLAAPSRFYGIGESARRATVDASKLAVYARRVRQSPTAQVKPELVVPPVYQRQPPLAYPQRPIVAYGNAASPFAAQGSPASVYNPPSVYSSHGGPPSLLQQGMHCPPRTPNQSVTSFADIQSPQSNASSIAQYHRNMGSVEVGPGSCSVNSAARAPEAHSLVMTLLICDTFINMHYDASFDSCPICACHMSHLSAELALHVPLPAHVGAQIQSARPNDGGRCGCGFSALRYRYLSDGAGLFIEDEREATLQLRPLAATNQQPQNDARAAALVIQWPALAAIADLLRQQALFCDLGASLTLGSRLNRDCLDVVSAADPAASSDAKRTARYSTSALEYNDFAHVCNLALAAACKMMDCTIPDKDDNAAAKALLPSEWGVQRAACCADATENDLMAVVREVVPVMQVALQSAKGVCRQGHGVEGPLTWRYLERKCFRDRVSQCQPEPLPQLVVASDRDLVTMSPFAIRFWDRLLLEPYSQEKHVSYVAVVPKASPAIVERARRFFCELSKTYENCRLGRHTPIARGDGLSAMRVDARQVGSVEPPAGVAWQSPPWSLLAPDLLESVKAYCRACYDNCTAVLKVAFDRHALNKQTTVRADGQATAPSGDAMPPPAVPPAEGDTAAGGCDSLLDGEQETPSLPQVVVVYVLNPFSLSVESAVGLTNSAVAVALMQYCLCAVKQLTAAQQPAVQVELVDLQTLLDCSADVNDVDAFRRLGDEPLFPDRKTNHDRPSSTAASLRSLAFTVYGRPRHVSADCLLGGHWSSLTGFGPTSERLAQIRLQCAGVRSATLYRLYCAPYVLAPRRRRQLKKAAVEKLSSMADREEDVLFVSYCITSDRQWLVATATDQQGEMLENCIINLSTVTVYGGGFEQFNELIVKHNFSTREYAKGDSFIHRSLSKLWTFVMGVLALGRKPWRLVIGRVGRLGHNELRVWSTLLFKSQLRKFSQQLKEQCGQCKDMPVQSDQTPSIVSACLVSVEPEPFLRLAASSCSPDERFGQAAKHCPLTTPADASCTHILVYPTSASIQLSVPGALDQDAQDAGMDDGFADVFGETGLDEQVDDAFMLDMMLPSSAPPGAPRGVFFDSSVDSLNQQPLATGFVVSTASAAALPSWFWAACPAARRRCPAHLKSSLHVHTDGDDADRPAGRTHPLDSARTADVLRFVLESYNALSWLSLDARTGDRRSCLPVHVQALVRLLDTLDAFTLSSPSAQTRFHSTAT